MAADEQRGDIDEQVLAVRLGERSQVREGEHPASLGVYCAGMAPVAERSRCSLADGRVLTYVEFGAADGSVVLHHHGGLVSATDIAPGDAVARHLGVRWVSFDRPGIGGSTPSPGRTIMDGARDAEELLDHLGVDRVRLSGWSMGGQYALATAHHLADRVVRSAIVAGGLPLDDPTNLAELNAMDRRFTSMAVNRATELRVTASVLGGLAAFSPTMWARVAAKGEGSSDERAVRDAAVELASSAHDATRLTSGIVEEYRAWVLPWGFTFADVTTPVDVWQGVDDHLVPMAWAERMAASLPLATLHVLPDTGHFLLLNHAEEVLNALLAGPGH